MTFNTNSRTANTTVVSAAPAVIDYDDLEGLEPSLVDTTEASNSHQLSKQLDMQIVAAARKNPASIPALIKHLKMLYFDAQGMKNAATGEVHAQSKVLASYYTKLVGEAQYNLGNRADADWSKFDDHEIDSQPYYGKMSYVDFLKALRGGGFGILGKKVPNVLRIYSAIDGWNLHVNETKIEVEAKTVFRLFAMAPKNAVETAPWERNGVMSSSTNFDGWTMVIRPRKGQDLINIVDAKTGEVHSFDVLRLACGYQVYMILYRAMVSAIFPDDPRTQVPEYMNENAIVAKIWGSATYLPQNTSQMTFATLYFQWQHDIVKKAVKKIYGRDYTVADLASFDTWYPKFESVITGKQAARKERPVYDSRQDQDPMADPFDAIPQDDDDLGSI